MPVTAIYKKNLKEFQAFMLSEQARQPCIEAANDIVAALAIAVPRSKNEDADGHLADSYKVNEKADPVYLGKGAHRAPRVGADVYSDHPGAAPEEFGGKRNKPKRWMGKVGFKWHAPLGGGE